MKTVYKGMVIRLFPTKEQEQKMWQHIGASRFVWNYMRNLQEERHKNGEKHLSAFGMDYLLTDLKKQEETSWLCNVSSATCQRTCGDLANAYNRFFNRTANRPKLKKRKNGKNSYPLRDDVGGVWFSETHVQIPIVGKVAYKTNYDIPLGRKVKFIDPRVKLTANGKWLLSLSVECEIQVSILTDKPMGIDLGVKELAIAAYGDDKIVFHNVNKSKKLFQLCRKLKHLQRCLARKYRQNGSYEETKNIKRLKRHIRKLRYYISNIRCNYLHQTTHALVSLLPCRVVMENLNVRGMIKNGHLANSIIEQHFYEFRRQMEYKCAWNGIEFVLADRFFPSSKTCSCCGAYKKDLKLKDRTYVCSECGAIIDRDYNAAINLMNYKAQSST